MLSVNDLVDISYIPKEADISLKLLVDFYEQHFMKYIYKFTLDNNEEVILIFSKSSDIYHLSAAHSIYEKAGMKMDGVQFIQEIKNNNFTFNDLQNINPKEYKLYNMRRNGCACIESLLKRCDFLFYEDGKIPDSTIEVKYLLRWHFNDVFLHLGINTYKEGRPYSTRTLLTADGNVKDKYVEKATAQYNVKKLEIIERKTDRIIETIDRGKAIQTAENDVWKLAENWIHKKVSEAKKEGVLEGLKGREHKKELEKHLCSHKNTLETNVMNHDAYLTGKIVMNVIHDYIKKDFLDRFLVYKDKFKKLDQEKDAGEEPAPKPEPKERPSYTAQGLDIEQKEKQAREAAQPPVKPAPQKSNHKNHGIDD